MDILTTIFAYGYIFIVGFVFLIMLFQILAFYIAGRATGSINDELVSAFTLFGALLFIGLASTLVNAVLSNFLTGMLIPGIISFVVYLTVIIYAVVKIYELSIGKSILYLIISFIVTVVLSGLTVYIGTLVMPEINFSNVMETKTQLGTESGIDTMTDEKSVAEEETTSTETDKTVEENVQSAPKLPGSAE